MLSFKGTRFSIYLSIFGAFLWTGAQAETAMPSRPFAPLVLNAETPDQVVGKFNVGSLNTSTALSQEGVYHHHAYHYRGHFYATDGMVDLLKQAAQTLFALYSLDGPTNIERLQVGDLSLRDGGEIPDHGSHENGLDVDLIYPRLNHQEEPASASEMTESFVRGGRPSANFDGERTWDLIRILASSNRISRIYIDGILKRELCRISRARGDFEAHRETLRLLISYPHHRDHMHVRMTCPASSPRCVDEQKPNPPGPGC